MLDPNYVLAPFHDLIAKAQSNVLLALRMVERIEQFPAPTPEEEAFTLQLSLMGRSADLTQSKKAFKEWVLRNGFQDIHTCIRVTLERLFVYKTVQKNLNTESNVTELEKSARERASNFRYPQLISAINPLLKEKLIFQDHIATFNNARNCLVHANGIVGKKHCNNVSKDHLVITGQRFKLFFEKDGNEIPAKLGQPGPENAPLKLGAEDFQIEFAIDQKVDLSMAQFIDVLSTCVFFISDIELKLKP